MSTPYDTFLLWMKCKNGPKSAVRSKIISEPKIGTVPNGTYKTPEFLSESENNPKDVKSLLVSYVSDTHFSIKPFNFRITKDILAVLKVHFLDAELSKTINRNMQAYVTNLEKRKNSNG